MPGMDGMQFLRQLMARDSALPVIMITGHGDVPMAVEAMRVGAYNFLEKPFNPDTMSQLAKKATQQRRLTLDNRALRRELSDGTQLMKKLMGKSNPMQRLREDILDIAQADGHILIDGETGTGKTLVAHALHAVGNRAGKKFVILNCSAYEEDALMRRLFGPVYADDSFLPAIEEARGGTLVLEDIEVLSEQVQGKLLAEIDTQGTPAETRIIAISNGQEVGKSVADKLRPDLLYRLNALQITVPGNVRQLMNVAEQAVLQSRRGEGSISSLLMTGEDEMTTVVTTEGKPLKEYVENAVIHRNASANDTMAFQPAMDIPISDHAISSQRTSGAVMI